VCSVAKASKISLPHHISLTKNGLSKRKETKFSFLVPKGKDRRHPYHTWISNVWSFKVQHKVFVFPYFLMWQKKMSCITIWSAWSYMSSGKSKVLNMQFLYYMITIMCALNLQPATCHLQIRHFLSKICNFTNPR
jgi:hypothetical protein